MKRLFALITALLCILLLVPSAALATETEIPTGIGLSENTATYEAFDTPMTDVPEYRFVDPEKANQATRAGSGYLYSKYVYDSHKTVTRNSKSVIKELLCDAQTSSCSSAGRFTLLSAAPGWLVTGTGLIAF